MIINEVRYTKQLKRIRFLVSVVQYMKASRPQLQTQVPRILTQMGRCIRVEIFRLTKQLLRHNCCNTPPKVAPEPSTALPRVHVNEAKIIHQARIPILRDIQTGKRGRAIWHPTRLVQVELVRSIDIKHRPVGSGVRSCGIAGCSAVGDGSRNGRVVLRDEVAPNRYVELVVGLQKSQAWLRARQRRTHEGQFEISTLSRRRRAEVSTNVRSMQRGRHRVLVLVRASAFVAVRFRHPVTWADKSGFGIDVL